MLTPNFGATLRHYRKQAGLTSKQLHELSGLAKSYIGYLERGERNPSAETIKTLCTALDVEADVFVRALMSDYLQAINSDSKEALK